MSIFKSQILMSNNLLPYLIHNVDKYLQNNLSQQADTVDVQFKLLRGTSVFHFSVTHFIF
jgi:hypothetical protein